jgi:uncharacterized protein (TIGR02300 family)
MGEIRGIPAVWRVLRSACGLNRAFALYRPQHLWHGTGLEGRHAQREKQMSNPEWGVKRLCPETGKRFYDLNKSPIISPYTGKVVTIDVFDRRDAAIAAMAEKSKKAVKDDDDDLLVDDEATVEIDDELLEDEDDDTVALDDLTDVAGDDED